MTDTLTFVRTQLSSLKWPDYKVIAAETGVPAFTLWRIATGRTANPRHNTIEPVKQCLLRRLAA